MIVMNQHTYTHYGEYTGPWPWQYFTPREMSCTCCGELVLDEAFMDDLDHLRDEWGKPIVINSAHRCSAHNAAVGGVESSQHLCIAADCRVSAQEQNTFVVLARRCGFTGIGRYPNRGFVHLDKGPKREWRG